MEIGVTQNFEGKTLQGWRIVDGQTKQQVGDIYSNGSRARARVDRLDNAYGAYRYCREPVWA